MTSEKYKGWRDNFIHETLDLSDKKRIEYCNGNQSADVHTNFKVIAKKLGLTPMQVLSVYLNKHIESLSSFFKTGTTYSDETIESRVSDIINYLLLAMSMKADEDVKNSDLPQDR
jgi:hypothetical protein